MGRKIPTRKPADRYHHGDLRAALVRAGLELLRKDGLDGLSLRAVARRAGVSQTAPYAHFPDKKALLSAIAAEGERLLMLNMKAGFESSDDPELRMHAMARGYVELACTEPALYRLMISPDAFAGRRTDDMNAPYAQGMTYLFNGIAAYLGEKATPEAVAAGVVASWCMVHGLSHLLIQEQVSPGMLGLKDRDALATLMARFVNSPI